MLGTDIMTHWYTWLPSSCAGILAVFYACWRGVIAFDHIIKASHEIDKMSYEFSPNSGSSMRDQIDMLSEGQTVTFRRLDAQDRQLAKHEATLERIEDRLGP